MEHHLQGPLTITPVAECLAMKLSELKVWFCPSSLEERFFNIVAFLLNKYKSLLLNKSFHKLWLKMAQWCWKRRQKCEKLTDGLTIVLYYDHFLFQILLNSWF